MGVLLRIPSFGKYLSALNAAGIKTRTARGFFGGVTEDGQIVVTSWVDSHDGDHCFFIWRPNTNHGKLKTAWDVGNIRIGTEVRLILLRQRGNSLIGSPRSVSEAVLMPDRWCVVEMVDNEDWHAVIRRKSRILRDGILSK